MKSSRFRPIVLPGGRAPSSPGRPRLSRRSLRVISGPSKEVGRALGDAVAAARLIRREAEQRRARSLERTPDDSR
ncbi:MAG TPA: hypothetical protein VFK85_10540 [Anaeromyxobacteraceae bacterium]|nr:hypothetical protein [Anaeromyxobacteraceae bacterium]